VCCAFTTNGRLTLGLVRVVRGVQVELHTRGPVHPPRL
jgi:hypothetical protein